MKNNTLRFIIFIMAVAMTGLVLFQFYWINNAIKISNTRFRQNVHEALNSAVRRLERQEVFISTNEKLLSISSGKNLQVMDTDVAIHKSFSSVGNSPFTSYRSGHRNQNSGFTLDDSLILGDQKITIRYVFSNIGIPDSNLKSSHEMTPDSFKINHSYSGLQDIEVNILKNYVRFAEKSRMITHVLDELLNPEKPDRMRINKKLLEDILNMEFRSRGIDIDYEYAVIDRENSIYLLTNFSKDAEYRILSSSFSIPVFPNDFFGNSKFLNVYFPDQVGFLLKQLWLPLSASIFLLLLIIFSFSFSIFTIIRQKKLSEVKNDFINNMTHEFKTPISTVFLACEALSDQNIRKDQSFLNKYLQIIRNENDRLGRQVEKVLQIATLDKNDFKLQIELTDIHQVIGKALENIELSVQKRGGNIVLEPEASESRLYTDEVHLTNIIYNLLDNANKYSPEKPEITIRTFNKNGLLIINILDKGIGMTRENMNRIFDKFYRIPTGNIHDVKGFGLGLAYVKSMVTALGGEVNVSSIPGKGSKFELIFPLHYGSSKDIAG